MAEPAAELTVKHFRLALLWPLRLLTGAGVLGPQQRPWQVLRDLGEASPWREVEHDLEVEGSVFQERHYNELVTFLPYVQQLLYGEGRAQHSDSADAGPAMRVFRRRDIARLRVAAREGDTPVTLDVVHVHLYFFFDIDVVILNVEVAGGDLPLSEVQELMYRIGRAYPSGWDEHGRALHSLAVAELLGRNRSSIRWSAIATGRCWRAPMRTSARRSWRM